MASKSCGRLKIPGDIAFNGYFLYHFLLCSSDKTNEEKESLNGITSVVQSMQIRGMDNMTSLLKKNPTPSAIKKEYPLIRALLIVLERGVYFDGEVVPELLSSRFNELQDLLLGFNPYRPIELILDMNQTDTFIPLLNQLEVLLSSIDNQTLLSLIRSVLEDKKTRESTVTLLNRLNKRDNYQAWKNILNVSSYIPLSSDAISRCLTSWVDPQITTEESLDNSFCHQYQEDNSEYPAESFQKLLTELGEEKVDAVGVFLHSLFLDFLKIPHSERLSVIMRISQAIKNMVATHQSPLRTFLSRVDYFTRKDKDNRYEVNSRHADMLISTLKSLIEYAGIEIGQVVNSKLGIVKLEENIVELLYHGGKIKGCALQLPGLKDIDITDRKKVFSLIYRYLSPHISCHQGLTPLASHTLTVMQEHSRC